MTPNASNATVSEVARLQRAWFLTGATASSKTQVAIAVTRQAVEQPIEIVSMDSMALYRRMDVGTAKPTATERAAAPHHLIDVLDPHEDFSLAQYVAAARRAAGDIAARGARPLFVGGTPLYLKALLRGIFEGPPADWALRRSLEQEAARRGGEWLWRELERVDPKAAARLHANDTRRLVRAIEVHAKTGLPISEWQQQFDRPRSADECRVLVLDWPRDQLYRRIDRRVESMFADGLVDEVRGLMAAAAPLGRTARQALGYREVIEHLDGRMTLDATIDLVKLRTRQFAKRQLTWFRSLAECQFVEVGEPLDPPAVASRVLQMLLRN